VKKLSPSRSLLTVVGVVVGVVLGSAVGVVVGTVLLVVVVVVVFPFLGFLQCQNHRLLPRNMGPSLSLFDQSRIVILSGMERALA